MLSGHARTSAAVTMHTPLHYIRLTFIASQGRYHASVYPSLTLTAPQGWLTDQREQNQPAWRRERLSPPGRLQLHPLVASQAEQTTNGEGRKRGQRRKRE
jgi:hypothetical protein